MVSTTDGKFAGVNGVSRDLSNELDLQGLIALRIISDGILTTAKTARIERYDRSKHADLALVSRTGDFDGIPAVEDETAGPIEGKVYLLVPRKLVRATCTKYSQPWVRVVSVGESGFALSYRLTRLGWRRIQVESGPSYAQRMLKNSVIRTLALNITDYAGGDAQSACHAALAGLGITSGRLQTAQAVDGTLFTTWTELRAN